MGKSRLVVTGKKPLVLIVAAGAVFLKINGSLSQMMWMVVEYNFQHLDSTMQMPSLRVLWEYPCFWMVPVLCD